MAEEDETPSASPLWKIIALALAISAPCVAILLGLKFGILLAGAAAFTFGAFALPMPASIAAFFAYLLFDGALKVLSDYHPVVHVGQDIFLLCLLARAMADPAKGVGRWSNTPFFGLIVIFAVSVLAQFLNPFGLGLLPSIAGAKVYFSGIILFFLVFHYVRPAHLEAFAAWIVALGTFECALACTEYLWFPEKIFFLHPRYRALAGEAFIGERYRPFGTTSAAGAPSMWVYLCAPFAVYLLLHAASRSRRWFAVLFLALGVPTAIFCQTRAAMILYLLMAGGAFLAPNGRVFVRLCKGAAFAAAAFALLYFSPGASPAQRALAMLGVEGNRSERILNRADTLRSVSTYRESRSGAWDQARALSAKTIFGIGLSRVGAASAVWQAQLKSEAYFSSQWSFVDNLYLAIFTELGVFGILAWLGLALTLIITILLTLRRAALPRRRTWLWISGITPLFFLAAGLGSEGVLYMPLAAFFWTFLALGLRETLYT